jgi:hypothetical protein
MAFLRLGWEGEMRSADNVFRHAPQQSILLCEGNPHASGISSH